MTCLTNQPLSSTFPLLRSKYIRNFEKVRRAQIMCFMLTLSLVSWTVRELEFCSIVIMSSSFFVISFLLSGLLRTCDNSHIINNIRAE